MKVPSDAEKNRRLVDAFIAVDRALEDLRHEVKVLRADKMMLQANYDRLAKKYLVFLGVPGKPEKK